MILYFEVHSLIVLVDYCQTAELRNSMELLKSGSPGEVGSSPEVIVLEVGFNPCG